MGTTLEWILTNLYKSDMIKYLKSHPEDFGEVIKLSISDKQPYSWRASWVLWSCMEENDIRLKEYIQKILDVLPERKDEQQRELLIILQKMELNEKQEAILFNHCINIWETLNKKQSVRYHAFKSLVMFAKRYPELSNEIEALSNEQYIDAMTPGVKASIKKMINSISLKH